MSNTTDEITEILENTSELMNELLAVEEQEENDDLDDDDDFIRKYDEKPVNFKYNGHIKRNSEEMKNDQYHSPVSMTHAEFTTNKRQRILSSSTSFSALNYSAIAKTSVSPIVTSISTPASIRSYSSPVQGFSPVQRESPLQASSPYRIRSPYTSPPSTKPVSRKESPQEAFSVPSFTPPRQYSPPRRSSAPITSPSQQEHVYTPKVSPLPQEIINTPKIVPSHTVINTSNMMPSNKVLYTPSIAPSPKFFNTPRIIQSRPQHMDIHIKEPEPEPERPQPPSPSEVIHINKHEYTVLCEIGRGNTGKIFQILSHQYMMVFALKWIDIDCDEDRQTIENEINMLISLKDQEGIVRLLDYEVSPTFIVMVMEYGESDLTSIMRESLNDVNIVRLYWKQMLEAVQVIHRHQIVHSNLNPSNFVLVKGLLKLIDFGVALKFSDDTTSVQRTGQVGTVDYLAPEVLSGNDSTTRFGRASDVWSLGCMLYELVYGVLPFGHLSLSKKISCLRDPNYEISFASTTQREGEIFTIPPELIELLKRCLQRNPRLRSSITDLLRDRFLNTR